MTSLRHIPVLLQKTLDILCPKTGDRILDATLGLGGHSAAILEKIGNTGSLIGLDADSDNLALAKQNLSIFSSKITLIHTNFSALPECLPEDTRSFDVILADIGLSSPHLDDPARGFSFRHAGPLDLRFDRSQGITAAEILMETSEEELVNIFSLYGELTRTKSFVHFLLKEREAHTFETTQDLLEATKQFYGFRAPKVLPQIFQALRIAVNDELGALKKFLHTAPLLLAPGGRLAVISFHSLEDRIVKHALRDLVQPEIDDLTGATKKESQYELLTKHPVTPSEKEVAENPRSRSSKLRALQRKLM